MPQRRGGAGWKTEIDCDSIGICFEKLKPEKVCGSCLAIKKKKKKSPQAQRKQGILSGWNFPVEEEASVRRAERDLLPK